MNYQKIYDQIIQKARAENRKKYGDIYYESHHILPRCLGGLDLLENRVLLTGREHFLCHWLLVRIHPTNQKLVYAFWVMCFQKNKKQYSRYKPSSRVYEEAKIRYFELYSKTPRSKEVRESISRAKKGKSNPLGSLANKGKRPWNFGKGGSSYFLSGKKQTEEHIESRKVALKGKLHEIAVCPYCSKTGGKSIMKRWHFENCKIKLQERK